MKPTKPKLKTRTIEDLNPDELMRLDSARGLNINLPPKYQDRRGLRPSILDYNKAIQTHIYTGISIPEKQLVG